MVQGAADPRSVCGCQKIWHELGELTSVRQAVGLEAMVDPKHPDTVLLQYLASDQAKLDKLFQDPALLRTPIVRNGKQATVATAPKFGRPGPDPILRRWSPCPECQSEAEAAIPVSDPHPADR